MFFNSNYYCKGYKSGDEEYLIKIQKTFEGISLTKAENIALIDEICQRRDTYQEAIGNLNDIDYFFHSRKFYSCNGVLKCSKCEITVKKYVDTYCRPLDLNLRCRGPNMMTPYCLLPLAFRKR